jgi:hypothetical protein
MARPSQPPCRFDTKVESQIQHSEKTADSVNPENALDLAIALIGLMCVASPTAARARRRWLRVRQRSRLFHWSRAMRYHTPSIPAIECSAQVPDNTPVLVCPSCGDTMQHLRTIPKLGARLEQFIFVCPSCEQVETKEVKLGGIRKPELAPVY